VGVSDVARFEGTVGAYLAGIPLHRSPGTPLPSLVHYQKPHIPFGWGGGGGLHGHGWVWVISCRHP